MDQSTDEMGARKEELNELSYYQRVVQWRCAIDDIQVSRNPPKQATEYRGWKSIINVYGILEIIEYGEVKKQKLTIRRIHHLQYQVQLFLII